MPTRRALVLVAIALGVAGCSVARPATGSGAIARPATRAEGGGDKPATFQSLDRMLVRQADMGVEVEDVPQAANRTSSMALAAGGYIANSVQKDDSWHLEVRVPAPQLDGLVDEVSRFGKVTRRTQTALDVTERAVDLDARVESMRASRDRLRQLLAKAESVSEMAALESQLARAQADLDALEAHLRSVRSQVSLAALSADFSQPRVLGPIGKLFAGIGKALGKLFVIR